MSCWVEGEGWQNGGPFGAAGPRERASERERERKQPLRATDEEACKADKQWYGEKGGRVRNGKQVRGEMGKRTEVRARKLRALEERKSDEDRRV